MARNPDGSYDLPLDDVVSGTPIEAAWANTTMNDLAASMTDSLDRNGRGGMLQPLKLADGTAANVPGLSFSAETDTGLWRSTGGVVQMSILGGNSMQWTTAGVNVWDGVEWKPILVSGDVGSGDITYDPTDNTIILDTTVQGALDTTDTELADYNLHKADANIHFSDVLDGQRYVRTNTGWQLADNFYLGVSEQAADSDKVDGYDVEVVTALPNPTDANTIYFVIPA